MLLLPDLEVVVPTVHGFDQLVQDAISWLAESLGGRIQGLVCSREQPRDVTD